MFNKRILEQMKKTVVTCVMATTLTVTSVCTDGFGAVVHKMAKAAEVTEDGFTVVMPDGMSVISAEEKDVIQKIPCGDNVYGTLDSVGTLTISGTGAMWDVDESCFSKIKDDVYQVVIEEGVTSIGDGAFIGRKTTGNFKGTGFANLQNVVIGKDVTSIGEYAFIWSHGLYSIDIPENVQVIEKGAFFESGLTECTLHKGLRTIGEEAFMRTSLINIIIPEGLSSIEKSAFWTETLKNVTIPHEIGIIKNSAFKKVNAVIYSKDVVIGEGAFGNGSVLKAKKGSSAEIYAKNNNLEIKYLEETTQPSTTPVIPTASPTVTPTQKPEVEETIQPTIVLTKSKYTIGVNEKVKLEISKGKAKTFASENQNIAIVNQNGLVKAKREGTVKITAFGADGTNVTCTIVVKKAPKYIKASLGKKTLKKGKKTTLKVKFSSGAYSNKLTFTSSNKKVATVNKNGVITAKKKGKTVITVKTYNGKKSKVTIRVK